LQAKKSYKDIFQKIISHPKIKGKISIQAVRNSISEIRRNNPGITLKAAAVEFAKRRGFKLFRYLDDNNLKSLQYLTEAPRIKTVIKTVTKSSRTKRLINFRSKYPEVFYDNLENEINIAYSNPKLPNATLMLCRKLIENLVYNLLEYKFQKKNIQIYFNTSKRRSHDFSILLDNLDSHKSDFELDQQDLIKSFLKLAQPFRRDANIKTHRVIEYLSNMSEINKFKIPDMVQILLKLIEKIK
jgi:hypothetical protein